LAGGQVDLPVVYARTMKRMLLLFLATAAGLSAQVPDAVPPAPVAVPARVFALNLFALPMDVQWGNVWEVDGLFSRSVSKAALVETGVGREVHFRRKGQSGWSTVKNASGQSVLVALESGATYVLVVRVNGGAELVKVDAPVTDAPKVLFVNAAKEPAAQLRLGTAATADGLSTGWTAFVDAPVGPQTLSWSWPTMPPGTDVYKAASNQPGQPAVVKLTAGHWYLAVVSSVYGQVTDITP
jgi:hypothetical protein